MAIVRYVVSQKLAMGYLASIYVKPDDGPETEEQ